MNVLIYLLHNYYPYAKEVFEIATIQYKYIEFNLEKYKVDKIIFAGLDYNFDSKFKKINNTTIEYINLPNVLYNKKLEFLINSLNENDRFIVIDSDVMIYDYNFFNDIFDHLNYYDIITCLDDKTQIKPNYYNLNDTKDCNITDDINAIYKLQIMRPNEFRDGRTRFTHFPFACSKFFYKKYSENCTDDKFEAFEIFSRNIAKYVPNAKIKELVNYKNSITLTHAYEIYKSINTDDKRSTFENFNNSKYYHIANLGSVSYNIGRIITNFISDGYILRGTPFEEKNIMESTRLLAWFSILLEKVITYDSSYEKYKSYIYKILKILNINEQHFDCYLKEFKIFHRTHLL